MKKLFVLLPVVALMAACSSTKEPVATVPVIERETYEARAIQAQDRRRNGYCRHIRRVAKYLRRS